MNQRRSGPIPGVFLRRALAALALAASPGLFACSAEPLPARTGAPESLQRLGVYLDPKVSVAVTAADVSPEDAESFGHRVRAAVAQELSKAGLMVVTGAAERHDLTLKFHVQIQGSTEAIITATAERDDVEIAKFGYAASHLQLRELAPHAGIGLVNAFAQQRSVAEFARDPKAYVAARKPRVEPVIMASVRPLPSAPAAVEAPVAPAPVASLAPAAPAPAAFVTAAPQPTAYALVIGIEEYRDLPSPSGARADAQRFARVLRDTFGVPEAQAILAIDGRATRSDIEKHLDSLAARVRAGDRIYFFFSGHGAPDPSLGTPYLVPYDGDPSALTRSALPLADVLKRLRDSKAKEVLAFVDTCFSGSGGRSVLPAGARPLVRVKVAEPTTGMALYSAASGAEISGPADGGKSGLFSDYLVEGLGSGQADIDGDGQISLRELDAWVRPRVARDAKRVGRDQTPSLVTGAGMSAENVIVGWGYRRAP